MHAKIRTLDSTMEAALQRASERYRRVHPFYRWYAWFKYRLDPCYRAVAAEIPPRSHTVDLGTGLGMLPTLLSLWGEGRTSLGVEIDRAKAHAAREATRGLHGVEIAEGDALDWHLPDCDVVTLVDVLHYYPPDMQRDLLARCARALRPGGRLLVREGDSRHRGGAGWTRWIESLSVRLGWNQALRVFFRPIDEIAADLTGLGFGVRMRPVAGHLHPGNVLLVAERLSE